MENKIGFWAGIIAFAAMVLYFIFQVLQVLGLLVYPLDQILIFGSSLFICIPFMLAMLALHYITQAENKIWSHGALIFTVLYVGFVTANYVVQLATVIPITMKGDGEQIHILAQTPHSLFWDFDAIGYLFMGFATLMAVPIFEKIGIQKWVRYSFLTHALVSPLIAFVYFYPTFSNRLLLLATPWAITAPVCMLLLALMFRKNIKGVNNVRKTRIPISKQGKLVGTL